MGIFSYTFCNSPIGGVGISWIIEPKHKILSINLSDSEYLLSEDKYIKFLINRNVFKKQNIEFLRIKYESELPDFVSLFKIEIDKYFFQKKAFDYPIDFLFLDSLSEFSINVLLTLYKVPFGSLISYKELASKSGYPKAFRAVGSVMNKNPYPLLIPCHRVIKEDRTIGGFAPGIEMKKKLLKHEGSLKFIK